MALVLLPVGWTAVLDGGVPSGWQGGLLAALVVLHGCTGTARRWPVSSYAVGAAAMLVLVAGPDLGGPTAVAAGSEYAPVLLPSSLCFFVLLYCVSARSARPWPTAALAVGLVGCLLTVVRLWGFAGAALEGWSWWLMLATATVGGTVAAWALGRFRATRAEWVAQLAERGAADERRRIAREMHDVVAHSLAVVVSHAEAGRLVAAQSPDRAHLPSVPPSIALTVYRVVQEALTNVARHARPGTVARVSVDREREGLHVLVLDDGGAPPVGTTAGRGLTGMRERVEAVGGTLEAGPVAGGWRVSARMPA